MVSIHAPAKGRLFHEDLANPVQQVSIHAPAKGRLHDDFVISVGDCVSIHAPAKGRRLPGCARGRRRSRFNPRPREGGDLQPRRSPASRKFQSTPPRRGDRSRLLTVCRASSFNPRPREGATPRPVRVKTTANVSIHAPAKGATVRAAYDRPCSSVSIHAPAKGRRNRPPGLAARPRFNPRPREGGDRGPTATAEGMVSIHAPAKGATCTADAPVHARLRFQSTPPRRGDIVCRDQYRLVPDSFNPRPREGGDQSVAISAHDRDGFNPRPREGATRTAT